MCCNKLVHVETATIELAYAYLVEGQHLTNELTAVLHGGAHLVVDLSIV